ncbi:MAG: hypothetical protein ACR2NY_01760 [Alphaproteobacteria bacterium]
MNDFFLFFKREAMICLDHFTHYLLPLFVWLSGFFIFRLLLIHSLSMADDFLFICIWFLFLWFFALNTMGLWLYKQDLDDDLPIDIILAKKSLLAYIYAKWAGLVVFSALPLWLLSGIAMISIEAIETSVVIIFMLGGFLFIAHLALLINFLASLTRWGKGGGFFMVIIILPLLLPCFLFVLLMLYFNHLQPMIFFQLAYFILSFSFLPIASAFIIKQEA